MGILDRFIKTEIQQKSIDEVRFEEQQQQMMEQQRQTGGFQSQDAYQGGRQQHASMIPPIPPTMNAEMLRLYVEHSPPQGRENFTGKDRFWFTNSPECARTVATGNLNGFLQDRLLRILQQCRGFDGCDNVDNLIDDLQLEAYEINLSSKARSDMADGIRERIVPQTGVGLQGEWKGDSRGERPPNDQKRLFGILGSDRK